MRSQLGRSRMKMHTPLVKKALLADAVLALGHASTEATTHKARTSGLVRTMAIDHGTKLLRTYEHVLRSFVIDADNHGIAKLFASKMPSKHDI
jgi:hypothetical protein